MPSSQTELPTWTRNPILSHLDYARPQGIIQTEGSEKDPNTSATAATKAPPLRELLKQQLDTGQETAGLRDEVLAALTARMARALTIPAPASEMDTLKSPSNLGADSLVAAEVRNWLLREGGVASRSCRRRAWWGWRARSRKQPGLSPWKARSEGEAMRGSHWVCPV
ncbi:hypothetical protein PG984_005530 [Apiospora sp. TS-2023a]